MDPFHSPEHNSPSHPIDRFWSLGFTHYSPPSTPFPPVQNSPEVHSRQHAGYVYGTQVGHNYDSVDALIRNEFWNGQVDDHHSQNYPQHDPSFDQYNHFNQLHSDQWTDMNPPYEHDQHQFGAVQGLDLDDSLRHSSEVDPSTTFNCVYPGQDFYSQGLHYAHGEGSSQPVPRQLNQETNDPTLASDIASRPGRLSEYEWQKRLQAEQVLEVYKTIVPHWPEMVQGTMKAAFERLNVYLDRDQKLVSRILAKHTDAISKATKASLPAYHGNQENQNSGPTLSEDEIIKWILSKSNPRFLRHSKRASWIPSEMKTETARQLVEILRRVWIKDVASTKALLKRMGPAEVNKWAGKVLYNGPKESDKAAKEWMADHKAQTSKNIKRNHYKNKPNVGEPLLDLQNASDNEQHHAQQAPYWHMSGGESSAQHISSQNYGEDAWYWNQQYIQRQMPHHSAEPAQSSWTNSRDPMVPQWPPHQ